MRYIIAKENNFWEKDPKLKNTYIKIKKIIFNLILQPIM